MNIATASRAFRNFPATRFASIPSIVAITSSLVNSKNISSSMGRTYSRTSFSASRVPTRLRTNGYPDSRMRLSRESDLSFLSNFREYFQTGVNLCSDATYARRTSVFSYWRASSMRYGISSFPPGQENEPRSRATRVFGRSDRAFSTE